MQTRLSYFINSKMPSTISCIVILCIAQKEKNTNEILILEILRCKKACLTIIGIGYASHFILLKTKGFLISQYQDKAWSRHGPTACSLPSPCTGLLSIHPVFQIADQASLPLEDLPWPPWPGHSLKHLGFSPWQWHLPRLTSCLADLLIWLVGLSD